MQAHVKRITAAIEELRQGKMIILTDDPDRENEGDLIFPAENATAENVNFMIRHGSGIVCLSMQHKQLKKLGLTMMVSPQENTSQRGTPFTVSIEAKHGIKTGVSASDRAHTIMTAMNPRTKPDDLVKPGHIFPLHAQQEGVLARQGHTEGAIDIVRLAGFKPAAVLCEIMNPDGSMASGKQLQSFARKHRLKMLAIEDILNYRLEREDLVEEQAAAFLPLEEYGKFQIIAYKEKITGMEHVVLKKPKQKSREPLLVRIHSSCLTGDLFGSERCDCRYQLHYSMQRISEEGGMLIYLNQEGRGIGILNKVKAYALQEQGMDTIEANHCLGLPADLRRYHIAANILKNNGIKAIRLLTNNPEKINQLRQCGIDHVEPTAIPVFCNEYNKHYLQTKKNKFNHLLDSQHLHNLGRASS